MDEPTIDCSFCDRRPVLEFQEQYLTDSATWRSLCVHRVCEACLERVTLRAWLALPHDQRMVVVPL